MVGVGDQGNQELDHDHVGEDTVEYILTPDDINHETWPCWSRFCVFTNHHFSPEDIVRNVNVSSSILEDLNETSKTHAQVTISSIINVDIYSQALLNHGKLEDPEHVEA